MNSFLILGIGVCLAFGVGTVFRLVFNLIVATKRRELEAAADLEYEEMMTRRALMSESSFTFIRRFESRHMTEAEAQRANRLTTNAGKEILRLERIGRWVFIVGALIALVVLIVYLKMS